MNDQPDQDVSEIKNEPLAHMGKQVRRKGHFLIQSFGAINTLAEFMPQKEFTGLQILNKFAYTTAIARVQTSFDLGFVCFSYFTHPSVKYSEKLMKYDWRTDKVEVIEKKGLFDFKVCQTVQVKRDIFAIRKGQGSLHGYDEVDEFALELSFRCYSNLESANPSVATLSIPQVIVPSIAVTRMINFKD